MLPNIGTSLEKLLNSAVDLHQAGRLKEAETLYRQILQSTPNIPEIHNNLGCLYFSQGQLQDAVQSCLAALRIRPDYAEALNNLGNAYKNLEQYQSAIDCYLKASRLNPSSPTVYNNMGVANKGLGEIEKAEINFREAISLKPAYAEAHQNLGNVLQLQGRLDEAVASFHDALRLDPQSCAAYVGLGNTLLADGRINDAMHQYESALKLKPDYPEARWNQALAYLLNGELEKGWEGHELRLKFQQSYPHAYGKPFWKGENFQGRRLLIYDEIGYGDVFQFVRYLPLVKERGGTLIFECKPGLSRLLHGFPGIDELLERGNQPVPESAFDLQLPMESLPGIFAATLQTIPDKVPYLKPATDLLEKWQKRLENARGLKVGLVWSGNPYSQYDKMRSCTLSDFSTLAEFEGVTFVSLQKGPAEMQLTNPPQGMRIIALGSELSDFADTAAVIESLDLVISVETAVPHLAGALGKKVWTILSFVPAWRWMMERSDSPWYPSMRLFRQTSRGEWEGVMQEVAKQLKQEIAAKQHVAV